MSGVSTQEVSSQTSQRRQREWVDGGWGPSKPAAVAVTGGEQGE